MDFHSLGTGHDSQRQHGGQTLRKISRLSKFLFLMLGQTNA